MPDVCASTLVAALAQLFCSLLYCQGDKHLRDIWKLSEEARVLREGGPPPRVSSTLRPLIEELTSQMQALDVEGRKLDVSAVMFAVLHESVRVMTLS
jgi:hypothetical protein